MDSQNRTSIDCACVIHGKAYPWTYVEHLHNGLVRNFGVPVTLHVYTESHRPVPSPFVKHALTNWINIAGPRKAWWYKMQLFNSAHFHGDLLYLDLDTVIVNRLDWILDHTTEQLWTIRDFKYLQTPTRTTINSSVMWFNTDRMHWLWDQFNSQAPERTANRWHGDQDFIFHTLQANHYRFFPDVYFRSWRWQCVDGGYDFARRRHRYPGTGVNIDPEAAVLVFHGHPKPHEINTKLMHSIWC